MAIAENVLDAVYKSRKTVIVMSKNFLKSMWGQYELQQAHNKAIVKVLKHSRWMHIIKLLLAECSPFILGVSVSFGSILTLQ